MYNSKLNENEKCWQQSEMSLSTKTTNWNKNKTEIQIN